MHDDHWLSILNRFVTAGSWCPGCLPWMELGGLDLGLGVANLTSKRADKPHHNISIFPIIVIIGIGGLVVF